MVPLAGIALPGVDPGALWRCAFAKKYRNTICCECKNRSCLLTRTLGVSTDLIRGDVFFRGEIMAGALIAGIPVALAYNLFLDRFISGITGGAVK